MKLSGWRPHGVSGSYDIDLFACRLHQSLAGQHHKDLPVFMTVPVRSGSGCETDVVDGRAVRVFHCGVGEDIPCERGSSASCTRGLIARRDDFHR